MKELQAIVCNTCRTHTSAGDAPSFEVTTTPSDKQKRAWSDLFTALLLASALAERMQQSVVDNPLVVKGMRKAVSVMVSFGVATACDATESGDAVIRHSTGPHVQDPPKGGWALILAAMAVNKRRASCEMSLAEKKFTDKLRLWEFGLPSQVHSVIELAIRGQTATSMARTIVFFRGNLMAMSPNFFNKRETISPAQRPGLSTSNVSSFGASTSSSYPSSSDTPSAPVTEASQPVESSPVMTEGGGSKLTVGPNIKLKGVEITDCDTLVVEGLVEATMDSRVMQVSEKGANEPPRPRGAEYPGGPGIIRLTYVRLAGERPKGRGIYPPGFKGSAEIDIAEIHGHFDGNLTVRQKLIIFATGKVTGKVSYGKLVIEEGGQISGDIQFGAASGSKVNTVEKSGLSVAR